MNSAIFASSIIFEEEDILYEEEILKNPYTLKCWLRYIEHKKSAPDNAINMIYERALSELPGSYKLWYNYLRLRKQQVSKKQFDDPQYEKVNMTFERSLTYMHKMPRIWLEYLDFLMNQGFIIRTRRMFDKALMALPITQAHRIWKLYLEFMNLYPNDVEMVARCYDRYLKLKPEDSEDFVEYLKRAGRLDKAALVLENMINNETFNSKKGKSKHQLWMELCELISKHPDEVTSLDVEPIIRQGIEKYKDQVGILWNALADYYIRSKCFHQALNIFEEAVSSVMTVNDFTLVFDTYLEFMQSIIQAKIEASRELGASEEDDFEIEFLFNKAEYLVARRELLLNNVSLRQNPHNVDTWLRRVKLLEGNLKETVNTFTQGLQAIDPYKASGKLYQLWAEFAFFYEKSNQMDEARMIFEKGMNAEFKHVDELASLICQRVDMEERHENFKEAIRVLRKTVAPVAGLVAYHDSNHPVQHRVYRSHKIWSKLVDLEQAFGTYLTCASVFQGMIDYGIANPQDIINCALYHEENRYFGKAFEAYQKGIGLFKWPNVNEIWKTYLNKFMERYGGRNVGRENGMNLEKARDLFEQCLMSCPSELCKIYYLMYAKLEEDSGNVSQAMAIYERATKAVPLSEQYEMYNIYLKKAAELDGLIATRPIYMSAIESLPTIQSVEMGMRFAEQETKFGEIDRARAIYSHCSENCDPKVFTKFWNTWKDFEMKHGNEDTLREMARVRRSVLASMNTQVSCMNAQMLMAQAGKRVAEDEGEDLDSMRSLEKRARMLVEESAMDQPMKTITFVRSETTTEELGEMTKTNNPDEIDIADEDEEEEDANDEYIPERQEIPDKVFGNLKRMNDDD